MPSRGGGGGGPGVTQRAGTTLATEGRQAEGPPPSVRLSVLPTFLQPTGRPGKGISRIQINARKQPNPFPRAVVTSFAAGACQTAWVKSPLGRAAWALSRASQSCHWAGKGEHRAQARPALGMFPIKTGFLLLPLFSAGLSGSNLENNKAWRGFPVPVDVPTSCVISLGGGMGGLSRAGHHLGA